MSNLVEKWSRTGLLANLTFFQKEELAILLEDGAKLLVNWANNKEVHGVMINSSEEFAGLFLPAISRNYRINYKPFDLIVLAKYIQSKSELLDQLKKLSTDTTARIDYKVEFLNEIIK